MGQTGMTTGRILPPRQEPDVVVVGKPIVSLGRWLPGGQDARVPFEEEACSPHEEDPSFDVGCWRFRVRSRDTGLLEDLRHLCGLLAASPRPEVDFTVRLIECTERGKLPGWGWTRERIGGT
jgi:hypothetical protein